MTLNVGSNFKKRWLAAPEAVRQTFLDDLNRVCDILKPDNSIEIWKKIDDEAQKQSFAKIKQAYIDLKLQLMEEARLRHQRELQHALDQKRAAQFAYNQQLLLDEERQFNEQTQVLHTLGHSLKQQVDAYVARYHKNPEGPVFNFAPGLLSDHQIHSELETLRLRLQLEAEANIDNTLKALRQQLVNAAEEEIKLILKNSNLSDDNQKE